jgi:ATP-binding cassette, subfamily B, bacterial
VKSGVGRSSLRTRATTANRLIRELPSSFSVYLVKVLLLQVAAAMLVIVELRLVRRVSDEFSLNRAGSTDLTNSFLRDIGMVLAAHLAARTLSSLAGGYRGPLAEQLSTYFSLTCARAAAQVPYVRFEEPDFHDLLGRVRTGQSRVWHIANGLIEGISLIATGAAVGYVLLRIAPLMALAVLSIGVPLLWVARANARDERARDVELTEVERLRESLDRSLRSSSVAQEVRTLNHGSFLLEEMRRALDIRCYHHVALMQRRQRRILTTNIVLLIAAGLGILAVSAAAPKDRPALSTVGVAGIAAYQLFGRIRSLSDISEGLRIGAYVLDDYAALLAEPRLAEPEPNHRPVEAAATLSTEPTIALINVGYTYPEAKQAAVTDINLTVAKGEFVAIVGDNGSGKSTLAKLISGLLPPKTGHMQSSAAGVTTLFQDYGRYELSLRANLLLGNPAPPNYDDILSVVGVAELARSLPSGDATVLSPRFEHGVDLSGGQWQRVALARTLLLRRELLVLDEPSSALDSISEENLLSLIGSLRHRHAIVLVTHRLATARRADRIVFMSHGRVAGIGTHQELLGSCPDYCERYELQATGYRELITEVGTSVE